MSGLSGTVTKLSEATIQAAFRTKYLFFTGSCALSRNEAVFTLEGARMDEALGSRARKLIEEWALENAADLRAAGQLAISGKEIPWITPLQ